MNKNGSGPTARSHSLCRLHPAGNEDTHLGALRAALRIRAALTSDVVHCHLSQPRCLEPALNILALKAHPAVVMLLTQKVNVMLVQGDPDPLPP